MTKERGDKYFGCDENLDNRLWVYDEGEIIKRAIATPFMSISKKINELESSKDELNRVSSVIKK